MNPAKRRLIVRLLVYDALFTLLLIFMPPTFSGRPFGHIVAGDVVAGLIGGVIFSLLWYFLLARRRLRAMR